MRPYLLTYLIIQGLFSLVPLINEIKGQDCSIPSLSHGKVRPRNHGRTIKYQCIWGYELMGQRYSSCLYGRWDTDVPICIRPGCKPVSILQNGIMLSMRKNAVAMAFCNPGYVLEGSTTIFCDGVKWNSTQPTCKAISGTEPTTSCDFELPGICGWKHDPLHDFDWRRQNKNTPSGHIGTGPSYDHTLGFGKTGYYMYIESSSRLVNDTARLLSPIYPANLTQNGCFVFYYHMYGRDIGSLHVIVRPESSDLKYVVHDADLRMKYTLFEKRGNQGNVWFRGFFDLDVLNEPFQIVIEGVRGTGYVSDIAIDDVALLQGNECAKQKERDFGSIPLPVITRDSCLNRCNRLPEEVQGELVDCQCYDGCVYDNTCCLDYTDLCVFGTTDPTVLDDSTTITDLDTTSVPPPLPPSLKMTATNAPDENPEHAPVSTVKAPTIIDKITLLPQIAATTNKYPVINPVKTDSPTITSTTQFTTRIPPKKLDTKIIPKLKFATPTPPFINATGFLNKTNSAKNESQNNNTSNTNASKDANKSTAKDVPKIDTTKTTTDGVPTFSKTWHHYGITTESVKLTKDIQYGIVTDKTIDRSNRHEKMIYNKQDGIVDTAPPASGISTIFITIFLLLAIFIIVLVVYSIKRGAATKLVDRYTKLRKRSASQNSSDHMRFLVQEEELEHEYEAS